MAKVLHLRKPQLYVAVILKMKGDAGPCIIAWELWWGSWEDWGLSGACPHAGKQVRERVRGRPTWRCGFVDVHNRNEGDVDDQHRQMQKQAPRREPNVGLDRGSPRSCPGRKAVLNR